MAKETITSGGKVYKLWYTSNTQDEKNSKDLIEAHGGTVKIVKSGKGCAFYYRGVDLNKIPRKEFEKYSR